MDPGEKLDLGLELERPLLRSLLRSLDRDELSVRQLSLVDLVNGRPYKARVV